MFSRLNEQIVIESYPTGGGGGTPHMKGMGMLVGNFESNP